LIEGVVVVIAAPRPHHLAHRHDTYKARHTISEHAKMCTMIPNESYIMTAYLYIRTIIYKIVQLHTHIP
jgi:hypothetical protein